MKNNLKKFITVIYLAVISILTPGNVEATNQFFAKDLHSSRLSFLKNKGFDPKVIYDIGAFHGHWSEEISQVYPNAQFHLFEGNENHRPILEKGHFPFYFAILGDQNKTITFYSNNSTGDSVFCEKTKYYDNCTPQILQMTTLSDVVQNNNIPLPDLIKIDVQGAEKLIIKGSSSIISHAEVVILETKILEYNQKAPLIYETMTLMYALGYSLLDVLECHYLPTGELNEIDLLFVKNESVLIKKGNLIE